MKEHYFIEYFKLNRILTSDQEKGRILDLPAHPVVGHTEEFSGVLRTDILDVQVQGPGGIGEGGHGTS